jgi:hypothetical protein
MSTAADLVSIRQLIAMYCHRIDNGSYGSVGRLWHPEGSLELSFTPRARVYAGREALSGWYANVHKTGRDRLGECFHPRHSIANPVITMTAPDRATVHVDIWAHDVTREGQARLFLGFYRDEVIRADGRWWFWWKRINLVAQRLAGPTTMIRPATVCYY